MSAPSTPSTRAARQARIAELIDSMVIALMTLLIAPNQPGSSAGVWRARSASATAGSVASRWPETRPAGDLRPVLGAGLVGLLGGAVMTFSGPGLSWVAVLLASGLCAWLAASRREDRWTLLCTGLATLLVAMMAVRANPVLAMLGVLVAAGHFRGRLRLRRGGWRRGLRQRAHLAPVGADGGAEQAGVVAVVLLLVGLKQIVLPG